MSTMDPDLRRRHHAVNAAVDVRGEPPQVESLTELTKEGRL
jgi:hypothetical protein